MALRKILREPAQWDSSENAGATQAPEGAYQPEALSERFQVGDCAHEQLEQTLTLVLNPGGPVGQSLYQLDSVARLVLLVLT
jgi:hypothetical protein